LCAFSKVLTQCSTPAPTPSLVLRMLTCDGLCARVEQAISWRSRLSRCGLRRQELPGPSVGNSDQLIIIRGHQRSSEVISGHQWSSVVISGHQWSSVVIRGFEYLLEVMILVTRHRAAIPIHAAYAAYRPRGFKGLFRGSGWPPRRTSRACRG
jgi:hypothetical protein